MASKPTRKKAPTSGEVIRKSALSVRTATTERLRQVLAKSQEAARPSEAGEKNGR